MKLTVKNIVEAHQALGQIMGTKELPVGCGFRLARAGQALEPDAKLFEQKRVELVQKHGTAHEGRPAPEVKPGDESWDAFRAELDALLGTEVELEPVYLVEADFAHAEIAPALLVPLLPFVREPEPLPEPRRGGRK